MSNSVPPRRKSLPPRKPSFSFPKVGKSLPPPRVPGAVEVDGQEAEAIPGRTQRISLSPACVVCGGDVVEKFIGREGARTHSGRQDGLHCKQCGLRYEFPPPAVLKVRMRR